jgi:uncharacterized YigZ family protein
MTDDQYLTIKETAEASIRIKGSRFLGLAFPVETSERFKQVLQGRSKQYHDATHNCWAYRILGNDRIKSVASDAGEPSGTAGKPILSTIEGRNLLNVAVIVTRYFGGTKLGTGGLARAYADCANMTLDESEVISRVISSQITIRFPYDHVNGVMRIIEKFGGRIEDSVHDQEATLSIAIPRSQEDHFRRRLTDACRGNVKFLY